jgi:TPP-dependent indolepyruvate ferredoxin oxidoreductase alpha subunit
MPYGKDDNENKGRKSGKGPKLSKGMKKAVRQEKKAVKKQSKRAKKAVKSVAKEIGKVSRFVGSQPTIGKIAGGSAYASGFKTLEKKKPTKKKKN